MIRLHEQVAFIRLEPLTPIHIGTGEPMDPLSYIMRKAENGQPFLHPIDVQAWVEAQPNPAELADIFAQKTLPEIRSYLAREISPLVDLYGRAPARVISREVYDKYEQELQLQSSGNQLLIDPALKNPLTGALTIPGSSIKGAIRTAVIDWLDTQWNVGLKAATNHHRGDYDKALEGLLGKTPENAFRNLKVGDFPAALGASVIVTAKEVRLQDKDKPGTPKNSCEASVSSIMGDDSALYGKIAVGAHGGQKQDNVLTVKSGSKQKTWTLAQLMELCTAFYSKRYQEERQKFYSQAHLSKTANVLDAVDLAFAEPAKASMVLRLGHYSHVECMTVSANQPQTRRLEDGNNAPSGTTRTLADGRYPFGWARLSVISAEEYAAACHQREEHDAAFLAERAQRYRETIKKREEMARQKAEKIRAKKERLEAESARQAALAAMSSDERLISIVESESGNENQAVELYGKLDALEGALQVAAAQALKAFWVKAGKWEEKRCTAKQWAKVQKLCGILGDV